MCYNQNKEMYLKTERLALLPGNCDSRLHRSLTAICIRRGCYVRNHFVLNNYSLNNCFIEQVK